ncbi:MAG: hypothetical protein AB7G37_06380 [Solirubrobacteraceae bacterium]
MSNRLAFLVGLALLLALHVAATWGQERACAAAPDRCQHTEARP